MSEKTQGLHAVQFTGGNAQAVVTLCAAERSYPRADGGVDIEVGLGRLISVQRGEWVARLGDEIKVHPADFLEGAVKISDETVAAARKAYFNNGCNDFGECIRGALVVAVTDERARVLAILVELVAAAENRQPGHQATPWLQAAKQAVEGGEDPRAAAAQKGPADVEG